ncbi:hypothetical protein Vretimale_14747 [Volvox reticuliferus]|nr:hypothetical protein Vretifemale_15580 [Volvox reticuliferus]GIM11236.1 hypothetical protein Vretimale_14747 [Volvox reticuliferus]
MRGVACARLMHACTAIFMSIDLDYLVGKTIVSATLGKNIFAEFRRWVVMMRFLEVSSTARVRATEPLDDHVKDFLVVLYREESFRDCLTKVGSVWKCKINILNQFLYSFHPSVEQVKMSGATSFVSGPNPTENVAASPFIELGCPFNLYEAFKMLLLLPLLPFRLAIGGLALVAVALINSLVVRNWPLEKPLTPWRRRAVLFSKELVLITLWCLGFRIRVRGRENIKIAERLGAVAVFNHVSWIDAFVLVWLMAPSGVSKESNGRIPIIGQAVRALQTVYIPYDKLSRRGGGGGGGGGGKGTDTIAAGTEPEGFTASAATITAATTTTATSLHDGHIAAATGGDGEAQTDTLMPGANNGCSNGIVPCCDGSSSRNTNINSNSGSSSSKTARGSAGSSNNRSSSTVETSHACTDGAEGAAEIAARGEVPPAAAVAAAAAAPPPPATGSRRRSDVATSRVTDILMHRVHHPSYCKLGGFPLVVLAPEGTTANGRGLLNFRTGAFVLGRPILPICFR